MSVYRFIARIAVGLYILRHGWRRLTGAAKPKALAGRFGYADRPNLPGPRIWLHAASNGELASARGVINTLLNRAPDLRIVLTTNTETGQALAESWGIGQIDVALAPLDLPGVLRRFLKHWQPSALIVVENELWPERFAACQRSGIPVFIIGARLSATSLRNWSYVPCLTRRMLDAIRYLSAQDPASEERFRTLGLASDRIGPIINLKSGPLTATTKATLPFERSHTLLAASTHPGEENIVLHAFVQAKKLIPDLRLIIAPRHPRRSNDIASMIARHGLNFATRSKGEAPGPDTQVYLADTMGEMDLWYASAGMCFTGGSLVDHGGHTPFEPAAFGSAILHGPHVSNSAPAYSALRNASAATEVTDAETLADAIINLANASVQSARASAARQALGSLGDQSQLDGFYAALARGIALPALAPTTP